MSLQRFIDAQSNTYDRALAEIKSGRKQGHWIWFIFPQITGLGFSDTSKYYAIKNLEEASAYLKDPVLGKRLKEICNILLGLKSTNALQIFGSPDNMKLRSSMTLFSAVPGAGKLFDEVIEKFFSGDPDEKTLDILRNQQEKN